MINEYFAEIATDPTCNPVAVASYIHQLDESSTFEEFSEFQIWKMLDKQKKTAAGPDEIPYWIFNKCSFEISAVVTYMINKSLRDGKPPNSWKHAVITPIPKVAKPQTVNELRPISVTSILSRLTERLIVRHYLIPAFPPGYLDDQFAFRPTGSTTAALAYTLHYVTRFLEDNKFVRVLLIDYSKAFDSVNHEILLNKLTALPLPQFVINWIANYLTGRTQAVCSQRQMSKVLHISQSIVQGSGLGPYLYLIMASDLKTLSKMNKLCKYADDKTLISPSNSDISFEDEFRHILQWSKDNKLRLNFSKTQEIVFKRPGPGSRMLNLPPPLENIERVNSVKLLGCVLTDGLTGAKHVDFILNIVNQRLYLLNYFKAHGMNIHGLTLVFDAIVVSRIMYAMQAVSFLVNQADIVRINAVFKKAHRWGLTTKLLRFENLATQADAKLFRALKNKDHCLHQLLPDKRTNYSLNLRKRGHDYCLPELQTELHKSSFINRCLFKFV